MMADVRQQSAGSSRSPQVDGVSSHRPANLPFPAVLCHGGHLWWRLQVASTAQECQTTLWVSAAHLQPGSSLVASPMCSKVIYQENAPPMGSIVLISEIATGTLCTLVVLRGWSCSPRSASAWFCPQASRPQRGQSGRRARSRCALTACPQTGTPQVWTPHRTPCGNSRRQQCARCMSSMVMTVTDPACRGRCRVCALGFWDSRWCRHRGGGPLGCHRCRVPISARCALGCRYRCTRYWVQTAAEGYADHEMSTALYGRNA